MTNTPTEEREVVAGDEATPVPAAAPAPVAAEPIPFWHRRYVERYLVPLVLPIAVILFLVTYVLNISRLFLAGHGHISVMVGTAITVMILLGATLLSAASPRLRQSAITLVSAAFILSIMSGGWLVLGHAQPEKTGPASLPSTLKTSQTLPTITASPGGKFAIRAQRVDREDRSARRSRSRLPHPAIRSTSATRTPCGRRSASTRPEPRRPVSCSFRTRGRTVSSAGAGPRRPGHARHDHGHRSGRDVDPGADHGRESGDRSRLGHYREDRGTRTVNASRTASIVPGSGPTSSPSA